MSEATAPPGTIEAHGLTKSYGKPAVRVLDGIDLHVGRSTVSALLGPNGAGKTTAVRILATLTAPDSGTARVAGYDIATERAQVRRSISLTGQFAAVDETQTGEENLRMTARLSGLSRADSRRRADELLARFGLDHAARRLARTYSGGMRRRLDLAAGLVGSPEPGVFFLDEPTTGLDPRSRQELWQVVRDLAERGATVLLTTQYLEEADRLADRVAVLDKGRIAAEGTPDALKSRVSGHRLDLVLTDSAAYLRLAARAVHHSPETLTLASPPTARRPTSAPCSTRSTPHGPTWRASPCTARPSTTSSSPSPRRYPHMSDAPGILTHAGVMAGRGLRVSRRNTDAVITSMMLPIMLMLIFVYFFGGAIETGAAYDSYVMYVVPGVLLLCAGFGASITAVAVSEDMKGGIIDRFRSLDVGGTAVLAGHVAASTVRNLCSTTLVFGVALLIGFRPTATPAGWLAVAAVLLAYILALSWISAAIGLLARTPEAAGGFTFFMSFLPYPSSAFVPIESMPGWLHPFADHQPITPAIESLRALLLDQPAGNSPWIALTWAAGILTVAVGLSGVLFRVRTR